MDTNRGGKMKTPITYYGGKQQMAGIILGMLPKHKIYCEPFFGGGAVFFDIYNRYNIQEAFLFDINPELVILYNVIKRR